MGMYTSIKNTKTNIEYQIYTGNDCCEYFNLGDKITPWIDPNYPNQGYLLDGVYYGYSYPSDNDAYVIIKNSTILAIEPKLLTVEEDSEDLDNYSLLIEKYQIQKLPRSTWSDAAWKAKDKRDEENRKRSEEFQKSIANLPKGEALIYALVQPIKDLLNRKSYSR